MVSKLCSPQQRQPRHSLLSTSLLAHRHRTCKKIKHENSREAQDQEMEDEKSLLITPPDILGKAPVGEGSKMCGGVDGLAEGDGNASSTS